MTVLSYLCSFIFISHFSPLFELRLKGNKREKKSCGTIKNREGFENREKLFFWVKGRKFLKCSRDARFDDKVEKDEKWWEGGEREMGSSLKSKKGGICGRLVIGIE
jgi:hypothetical protein